jgi:hypothetical protein
MVRRLLISLSDPNRLMFLCVQVTQLVGYVGTLPSVQFEYTGEHGRVDHKGWQSGLQGTVCMSTCESMAEWTIRDCRYEYMGEHSKVDHKGL